MNDRKETLPKLSYRDYPRLASSGWFSFKVPVKNADAVIDWIREVVDPTLCDNEKFLWGAHQLGYTVSLRRHEDAVLFKLSCPGVKPLLTSTKSLFVNPEMKK